VTGYDIIAVCLKSSSLFFFAVSLLPLHSSHCPVRRLDVSDDENVAEAAQNLLTRLSAVVFVQSLRCPGISGGVAYQWPEWKSRTRLRCLVCHDAARKVY
jgi:hypothetical protein